MEGVVEGGVEGYVEGTWRGCGRDVEGMSRGCGEGGVEGDVERGVEGIWRGDVEGWRGCPLPGYPTQPYAGPQCVSVLVCVCPQAASLVMSSGRGAA